MPIHILLSLFFGLGAAIGLPVLSSFFQFVLTLLAFIFYFVPFCRGIAFFIVGLLFGYWQITYVLNKSFHEEAELITLDAAVQIVGMPIVDEKSVRFKAKPLSLSCANYKSRWTKNPKQVKAVCEDIKNWRNGIMLSHYFRGDKQKAIMPKYHVGDIWQVQLKLRKPRGLVNEYGFDYQGWLLANRIYATGYIVNKKAPVLVSKVPYNLGFTDINLYFQIVRERISQWLTQANITSTSQPLIRALLIGDKTHISSEQWDTLKSTGTVHLMAISGLHIGLAALIGFVLARCIFNVWVYLGFNYLKLQALPYIFSMLAAFIYAGLAGFSVPTIRALIMVLMVNGLYLLHKIGCPKRILLLCAILVLLLEPFAFINTGFWLSFGAVTLIFLFVQRSHNIKQEAEANDKMIGVIGFIQRLKRTVYNLTAMQLILFVGLFIPVLLLSQSMSLVSPLANLIFVPFVSLIIVPLTFLSALVGLISVSLSYFLLQLTTNILDAGWYVLRSLHMVQFKLDGLLPWFGMGNDVKALIMSSVCALLFIVPAGLKLRLCGLGLLVALIFYRPLPLQDGKITVLDVGQGLGVLIQTSNATVLYDTGNYYSPRFDIGKSIISPLLVSQANYHIDALFLSHSDADHVGGAKGVMNAHAIGQLVVSAMDEHRTGAQLPDNFNKQVITRCHRGNKWVFDNIKIHALWPELSPAYRHLYKSTNNRSCILLIELEGVHLLLMGDVSKQVEVTPFFDNLPPIDILVAGHHGSLSSSHKTFIRNIKPKHVVFSAGYKNRYGHPHPKVIERFEAIGAKTYNTAYTGAVSFIPIQAGAQPTVKVAQARKERIFRWLK